MTQADPNPAASAPSPHRPPDDTEVVYFEGSPQIRGELASMFGWWLLALALIAAAIGALVMAWSWWIVPICIVLAMTVIVIPIMLAKSTRYRITNYRIDLERGILSKSIDTLELWHVDDINLRQSLIERMLGVGTITIHSNDDTTPHLRLHSLPDPRPLFDSLKQRIISVKRQRGVLKMDIE
jgi:membrane protein YdbS with pleckstrin-like domain